MRILAVAHVLPSRQVSNAEWIEHTLAHPDNRVPGHERRAFGMAVGQYLKRCGAMTRYLRGPGERAVDLGVAAARRALAGGGVTAKDIDLLIYVGVGRGFLEPATANVFQAAVGLSQATCFDVLDACASWLRALDIARHLLRGGSYRRVMILNCECNVAEFVRFDFHSGADLDHLGAGLTIGEAATATIVDHGTDDSDYYASFRTFGEHHDLCQIPLPGADQFRRGNHGPHPAIGFYAYAGPLHKAAIQLLVAQYKSDPRLTSYQPDVIFGHSPSVPASATTLKLLGLDGARFQDPFPCYGNTVSASVPLAMSLAAQQGRLARGARLLVIIGSAGVTTGFCRFTY